MTTQEPLYVSAFKQARKKDSSERPSWPQLLRDQAITNFRSMGFPVARKGNEPWKYTDIGELARTKFELPMRVAQIPEESLALLNTEPFGIYLTFVNGMFDPSRSSTGGVKGVIAENLSASLNQENSLAKAHIAKIANFEQNAFTALNTAFLSDGCLISVPDDTRLDEPIHLRFLSTYSEHPTVCHPRVLVLAGKNSRSSIIQSFVGMCGSQYFTNTVSEIILEAGATMDLYRVQAESMGSHHIATTEVVLRDSSSFNSVSCELGGSVSRHSLNVHLEGKGAACSLSGLYLTKEDQHTDNQTLVDHAVPETRGHQLYKGILSGSSSAAFVGHVVVRPEAQRISSHQLNSNLLLSPLADVNTQPQLEIFADDVQCTHGSTVGRLDPKALFYLKSRGLDEKSAVALMIRGFTGEITDKIDHKATRDFVASNISQATSSL